MGFQPLQVQPWSWRRWQEDTISNTLHHRWFNTCAYETVLGTPQVLSLLTGLHYTTLYHVLYTTWSIDAPVAIHTLCFAPIALLHSSHALILQYSLLVTGDRGCYKCVNWMHVLLSTFLVSFGTLNYKIFTWLTNLRMRTKQIVVGHAYQTTPRDNLYKQELAS